MTGTFVPVDLDQVLDEFEEQEMKNGSPPKTSVDPKQNDSLGTPHNSIDPHLRFPSVDEPRTYSFNSPLDAILENHSNNIDKSSGTSLAQELAAYNFGPRYHDDDHVDEHEDVPDNEDGIHGDGVTHSNIGQNTANDGNDSETASEASSTSAVIAAAEKITEENTFSLQKSNLPSAQELDSQPFSLNTNESGEGIQSSHTSTLPSQSVTEQNDNLEDEPDFLSVLNSVVEDKSMCIQGSKSQTASFSSFDGSTSSSTELDEIKDILVDKTQDLACATDETKVADSRLISNEQGEKCSTSEPDSTHLDSTDHSTKVSNKDNICGDSKGDNIQPPEERNPNNEANFYSTKETTPSSKVLEADDLPGILSSENISVSNDVDKTNPTDNTDKSSNNDETASCSTRRISTDNDVPDGNQFFKATNNEPSASEKCIESWEKENAFHDEESEEEELMHGHQPDQQDQNGENLLLNLEEETSVVNPMIPAESVVVGSGLPHEGRPEEIIQNDPNLLENLAYQEPESLAHRMSPIDSGSADSLCGTQDEDMEDGMGNEPTGVLANEQSKTDLDSKMSAIHISSGDPEMGFVPPIWVPDDVATHCMTCGLKFSVIKRKHHCRACGKVLCSSCCNMKFALPYMGNKDARVCQVCCDILIRGNQQTLSSENLLTSEPAFPDSDERNGESTGPDHDDDDDDGLTHEAEVPPPIPAEQENLDEDELLDQALGGSGGEEEQEDIQDDAENNLVAHSPVVSSLSLPSDPCILPGNEGGSSASLTSAPLSPTLSDDSDISFRLDIEHVRALIPQESSALPPVLNLHKKAIAIKEHPDPAEIMYRLKGKGETVLFLLNKNLIVKVKIVKLRCCVKKKCWCFVTDGMGAASQEEMVILLECHHNENTVPKDVLSHFNTAFSYAKQGHVVSDLGFTIFGQPFLGSSSNAGFLYIKPSLQCLDNLPLPSVPYVVGILIQRQEAPWAQLFPLRLMLRLGTEFRYYPCPLWSVRNRPSVYGDIGHTIMNLLTDFKNFQYSIPRITGLIIHMEDTKTTVRMPQDRYDEIVKVLNAAEEHMFSFGANFSSEADSHLVCIQEGETYKTQAINIQNKTRKVTGASFIVFTGSLKTSNPNDAKVSIIEDGLMIQMLPDAILELRKALRDMQDYVIQTGSNTADGTVNQVTVEWATRDANQQAYTSPIDGRSLTNVPSIQVHSSCDFTKPDIYRIRWTNVFLERNGERSSRGLSSRGLSHLTAELARACCEALRPYLVGLFEQDLKRLSLRVNIDSDSVEYSIGANEKPLPGSLMADLDSALIPAINAAAMKHRRGPLAVELFFSIISLF